MPRGKRTVFAVFCSKTKNRLGTIRFHKQDKMGIGWKDHAKKVKKYCPQCRESVPVTMKEEKHSK